MLCISDATVSKSYFFFNITKKNEEEKEKDAMIRCCSAANQK